MYPTDKEWKRRVRELLRQRGAQAAAARAIGCDSSAITAMLRDDSSQSRLAGPLSEHLGIDPPRSMMGKDPRFDDWDSTGRQLTDEERDELLALARRLLASRDQGE